MKNSRLCWTLLVNDKIQGVVLAEILLMYFKANQTSVSRFVHMSCYITVPLLYGSQFYHPNYYYQLIQSMSTKPWNGKIAVIQRAQPWCPPPSWIPTVLPVIYSVRRDIKWSQSPLLFVKPKWRGHYRIIAISKSP